MTRTMFRLDVQQVNQACLFRLVWGRGQQLAATLSYPKAVIERYQEWQRAYLSFYKSSQLPIALSTATDATPLRGRVEATGSLAAPQINWQARLVEAEAKLLYAFDHWLRSAELFEIRREIARAVNGATHAQPHYVDIFLTCDPLELARLPWESWEIGAEFGATGQVRIARTPLNIRAETGDAQGSRQRRVRILAILGDDTGLNFQADREAVRSLASIATVEFVGWQPGQTPVDLKTQICEAIADQQGWDGLFFAGHSNETGLTGGELAIAPGVSLSISEITRSLTTAKAQGLKFAIFNSCSGLAIADALINLGLSQVVVMREPIHNRVAQEFLLLFLQGLANSQDVQESLLRACQQLKLSKNFTYPSAHLIPSLFCHPDAGLFRIQRVSWKQQLQRWLPTQREAIALTALLFLGWWPSAQAWLLEQRVWTQAVYRQFTHPVLSATPPVLLVQIDDVSIQKAGISNPSVMDREYLANLVEQLMTLEARVIGIDYLLDRPQANDSRLADSLQAAVEQGTWLVFAARENAAGQWFGVLPTLAQPEWSLSGDIWVPFWHINPLPWSNARIPPLAYGLATAYQLSMSSVSEGNAAIAPPPQPNLQNQGHLLTQVRNYADQVGSPFISDQMQLQPITAFSYGFRHRWLQPILDFSIPPEQVYTPVPAWQLLEKPEQVLASRQLPSLRQTIVLIAPGGYDEAGIAAKGEDNFPLPAAVAYWRYQQNPQNRNNGFTGGEAHAYMTHHFLTRRLVVPIPDLWMIAIAALMGKGIMLGLEQYPLRRSRLLLLGLTGGYGLISLQLYLTLAVLLPWLLPSLTVWVYVLPILMRSKHA